MRAVTESVRGRAKRTGERGQENLLLRSSSVSCRRAFPRMTRSTFHTGNSTILKALSTIPESRKGRDKPNHFLKNRDRRWVKTTLTPKVEAAAVYDISNALDGGS